MKKLIKVFMFLSVFLISAHSVVFALDPVASKAERSFGFLSVTSPLPSDWIEIEGNGFKLSVKNEEMIKVPIGEYVLTVKMQDGVKSTQKVTVTPTEFTAITIAGYGNLFVKAPQPSKTIVEVYNANGALVSKFMASKIKTLSVGLYRVIIKMPAEEFSNTGDIYPSTVTKNDVSIIMNETRELMVWK